MRPRQQIPFLSFDDLTWLRWLIQEKRKEQKVGPNRQGVAPGDDYHQAPEVYVALPSNLYGIPPIDSAGTGGIDPAAGDIPGSAECDIYQIIDGVMTVVDKSQTVYNIGRTNINRNWTIVYRTKFGRWIAQPRMEPSWVCVFESEHVTSVQSYGTAGTGTFPNYYGRFVTCARLPVDGISDTSDLALVSRLYPGVECFNYRDVIGEGRWSGEADVVRNGDGVPTQAIWLDGGSPIELFPVFIEHCEGMPLRGDQFLALPFEGGYYAAGNSFNQTLIGYYIDTSVISVIDYASYQALSTIERANREIPYSDFLDLGVTDLSPGDTVVVQWMTWGNTRGYVLTYKGTCGT